MIGASQCFERSDVVLACQRLPDERGPRVDSAAPADCRHGLFMIVQEAAIAPPLGRPPRTVCTGLRGARPHCPHAYRWRRSFFGSTETHGAFVDDTGPVTEPRAPACLASYDREKARGATRATRGTPSRSHQARLAEVGAHDRLLGLVGALLDAAGELLLAPGSSRSCARSTSPRRGRRSPHRACYVARARLRAWLLGHLASHVGRSRST
jgi:hypothetical protein